MHEFGHAWDRHHGWRLSRDLQNYTKGSTNFFGRYPQGCDANHRLPGCNWAGYFYGGQPAAGSDDSFNVEEDFAESVVAYVYKNTAESRVASYKNDLVYGNLYYADYTKTKRWHYIDGLINVNVNP